MRQIRAHQIQFGKMPFQTMVHIPKNVLCFRHNGFWRISSRQRVEFSVRLIIRIISIAV